MSDPWFLDENFDGVPDEFFDDFMAHFDFPLEDVDPGVDWNANFQSLEPPPLSVLSDLSAVTKNNSIWVSCRNQSILYAYIMHVIPYKNFAPVELCLGVKFCFCDEW